MPRQRDVQRLRDAAQRREAQKRMLREWEAVRAALPRVDPQFMGHAQEIPVFASALCPKALYESADPRKVGTGRCQTEFAGGRSAVTCSTLSRHAGAAQKNRAALKVPELHVAELDRSQQPGH